MIVFELQAHEFVVALMYLGLIAVTAFAFAVILK